MIKENQETDDYQGVEKNKIVQEDEIDLVELAKIIWSKRKFIAKVTCMLVLIGLIIAFTSKVEYETTCKLLPESQESSMPDLGGLGGLAGLAGVDLSSFGGGGGVLTPEIYPEIVQSTPFLVKLINEKIRFERLDTTMSSLIYLKELDKSSLIVLIGEYTIGLPGKIKSLFSKDEDVTEKNEVYLRLSKEDWGIFEDFSDRLSVDVDSETGIINISVEFIDPIATTMLTDLMVKHLTEEVSNYKLEKTALNLDFVRERFTEAKQVYQEKQKEVARFVTRNRNITNPLVETEHKRLQNEMNIAFEVYKGLASQLEQARIKVKEDTPIFTVLEPVKIPVERSSPNRKLVILTSIFLGIFVSIVFIILRYILT